MVLIALLLNKKNREYVVIEFVVHWNVSLSLSLDFNSLIYTSLIHQFDSI